MTKIRRIDCKSLRTIDQFAENRTTSAAPCAHTPLSSYYHKRKLGTFKCPFKNGIIGVRE
jgi:hypothetical protein